VAHDPARIDAQLSVRSLYSEAPALAAGDGGVPDLLGVTPLGRLVVIDPERFRAYSDPVQKFA
jgi:hypothetical protein